MPKTATLRDLRNRFPEIRKMLEEDGEVLLSERGKTKYRLSAYQPSRPVAAPQIDYLARLISYHPKALTAAQARALHDDNRNDR